MKQCDYYSPRSLYDTLELLDAHQNKVVIVNGGTDIVEKIAHGAVNPEVIIYIKNVRELSGIRAEPDYISIGGAVTYNEILNSIENSQFSVLNQAIKEIGSPPIRVVATPAGNIGTAVPAADCNVAMMALGAEVVLASKHRERTLKITDMLLGYNKTALTANELIKEIRIPRLSANSGSAFVKLAKRKAQDIAQVSVGVCLTADSGVCRDIKIALGAVNTTAVRAYSLETAMVGRMVEEGAAAIKKLIPTETKMRNPLNKAYKETVIGVLVERAILKAYRELEGGKD